VWVRYLMPLLIVVRPAITSYRNCVGTTTDAIYYWRGATHAPLIHLSSSIYYKKIDFKQKGGQREDERMIFSISLIIVVLSNISIYIWIENFYFYCEDLKLFFFFFLFFFKCKKLVCLILNMIFYYLNYFQKKCQY